MREANGDAPPRRTSPATAERSWSTRSPTRPGCPPWSAPSSSPPGGGPARPPAGRSTAWLSRFKPDPLRRLHLDLGRGGKELTAPRAASVPRRRRSSGLASTRPCAALADDVGAELSPPWAAAVRRASVSRLPRPQRRARQGGQLHRPRRRPHPALVAGGPRAPVAADGRRAGRRAVAAGARGAGVPPDLPRRPPPTRYGLPLPTLLLLGGVALGVLLGLVCKAVVGALRATTGAVGRQAAAGGDRRGDRAAGREPVEAEVEAYRTTRAGLAAALR